jgi:Ca2+-binding EF-hand superfamily protein
MKDNQEYITRQEVETMFSLKLTDSQWRAVCSEMQEQPDSDYIDEFPTFQSVLEEVVSNIDYYEQEWIVWDELAGQTTAQALEKYEPNSTKRKE